jgi:hypothetical protein
VKRPEPPVVREEHTVTDADARFVARVHRGDGSPRLAAVVAGAEAGLLGVGVLAALVMAEGGVEFALVPRERNAVEEAVAVLVKLVGLDDAEPGSLEDGNLVGLGNRFPIPSRDGFGNCQ